ncbi:MAG TPA: hypothetical protein VGH27_22570 [Streptosporangiaceae bacterium]|jgi:hypothetical protein
MELSRRKFIGTAAGVAGAAALGASLAGKDVAARAATKARGASVATVPSFPLKPGCTTDLEYGGTDYTLAQNNFQDYTKSTATPGGYPWPFHVEKYFDTDPIARLEGQAGNGTAYFLISVTPDPTMPPDGPANLATWIEDNITTPGYGPNVLAFTLHSEPNLPTSSWPTAADYGDYVAYYAPTIATAGYNLVYDGASYIPATCLSYGQACYDNATLIAAGCDGYLPDYLNNGSSWNFIDSYFSWVASVDLPVFWAEFGPRTTDPSVPANHWDQCCTDIANKMVDQPSPGYAWWSYWNVSDQTGSYNPVTSTSDPKLTGLANIHSILS